jgi:hypothetical protein
MCDLPFFRALFAGGVLSGGVLSGGALLGGALLGGALWVAGISDVVEVYFFPALDSQILICATYILTHLDSS